MQVGRAPACAWIIRVRSYERIIISVRTVSAAQPALPATCSPAAEARPTALQQHLACGRCLAPGRQGVTPCWTDDDAPPGYGFPSARQVADWLAGRRLPAALFSGAGGGCSASDSDGPSASAAEGSSDSEGEDEAASAQAQLRALRLWAIGKIPA